MATNYIIRVHNPKLKGSSSKLSKVITACLAEGDKREASSIAFPLFGQYVVIILNEETVYHGEVMVTGSLQNLPRNMIRQILGPVATSFSMLKNRKSTSKCPSIIIHYIFSIVMRV